MRKVARHSAPAGQRARPDTDDVERFSDTTFKVKVAIPCQTSSNALEHERLADIDPVAVDADALLHRLAFGAAPVSAVHFGLLDCT